MSARTFKKKLGNICRLRSSFKKCHRTQKLGEMAMNPEFEFLDEIQTKVLGSALLFQFLHTQTTSYSFYSSVTVQCKAERRKIL